MLRKNYCNPVGGKMKALLLFVSLFMFCCAQNLELPLQDIAVIQDTTGLERILFKFDTSALPDPSMIDYAQLYIPQFLLAEPLYSLTLQAKLLTTQWEKATVTWNYPWDTPGADYDTTLSSEFRVSSRIETDIFLDITELVKQISSGYPNRGIVIMTPEYEGGGFVVLVDRLLNALNTARIVLSVNPAIINE
jgi:hypothetical protein